MQVVLLTHSPKIWWSVGTSQFTRPSNTSLSTVQPFNYFLKNTLWCHSIFTFISAQICEEVNRHCLDVLTNYVDEYKMLVQDTQGSITFYGASIDHIFSTQIK